MEIDAFGGAPATVLRPRAGLKRKGGEFVKRLTKQKLDQAIREAISQTVTGTMTKRVVEDAGADYYQLTKYTDQFGKRLTKYERQYKTVAAHMQRYIERFQRCSAGNSTVGAYALSYFRSGAAGTPYRMPVYLFDLTAVNNNVYVPDTGSLILCGGAVGSRLARDQGTGIVAPQRHSFFTEKIEGLGSEGTAVSQWTLEDRSTSTTSIGTSSLINWFDIRMMFYGACKRPSRVRVDIVRFTEDAVCPTALYQRLDNGNTYYQHVEPRDSELNEGDHKMWDDMWLQWTSQLIGNPISRRGTGKKAPIDVMYSKTFDFQPTVSTEDDRRGHQREFYLRYNVDKVHMYDEGGIQEVTTDIDPGVPVVNDAIPQVTADEMINPNKWSNNDRSLNSCFPANKGRTFLIVSGMTMEQNADGTDFDADKHASFDIILRRKRQQFHV